MKLNSLTQSKLEEEKIQLYQEKDNSGFGSENIIRTYRFEDGFVKNNHNNQKISIKQALSGNIDILLS